MYKIKALLLSLSVSFVASLSAVAAEQSDSARQSDDILSIARRQGFSTQVHGVVRGRYELNTYDGTSRFQARNARVSVDAKLGKVAEAFIQADFCDRGKVKMLDAWTQLALPQGVSARIGQFRLPFGDNSFATPATYWFANRSFVGKYMSPGRHVGFQLGWAIPRTALRAYAGVFNSYSISDHEVWGTKYNYAARIVLDPAEWQLVTGFVSAVPDAVRINSWNFGATYKPGPWRFEAEYLYRHYTSQMHSASHGYLVQADYAHPIRSTLFNQWSGQLRVDGMTDFWSGSLSANGEAITDSPLRNRITAGVTLSHIYNDKIGAHLRLNYEKYFYGHQHPSGSDNDKMVVELVVTF